MSEQTAAKSAPAAGAADATASGGAPPPTPATSFTAPPGGLELPSPAGGDKPAAGDGAAAAPAGSEAAAEEGAKTAEPPPAAPDYSTISLAEGLDANSEAFGALKEAAGKIGVSPDHLKEMLDAAGPRLAAEFQGKVDAAVKGLSEDWNSQWKATKIGWEQEIRADKDIGGGNTERTLGRVALAADFGGNGEAVRAALTLTGAGSHPAVVRQLERIGAMLEEGGAFAGSKAVPAATMLDALWPKT